MGLFKPVWMARNKDKALDAVKKVSEKDLTEVSLNAVYGEVRAAAMDRMSNEKCRACEVRYLCGGICKAWVNDKHNIDSGDFDCEARKEYFLRIAEMRTEN